ncbi:MAG TPA: pentapeptide repeat-containing protein [Candidatus Acidoferrales bacterium]
MAFLFKPAIPKDGMEDLSTAADPTPLNARPPRVAEQDASPSDITPHDDATLQEFLLRNFLTEESKSAVVEESSSNFTLDLPGAEDVEDAIENITTEPSAESSDDSVSAAPEIDTTNLLSDLVPPEPAAEIRKPDPTEWAFEEVLANHKEWLDSHGEAGKKADLRKAKLAGIELIGVNLRYADLQDANLKEADLLLADLRDACLVRANLQETCLVGANLEGANLEGASLETAMGLLPRQLAGSNLHEASLPPQILEFNALPLFSAGSKSVARLFATLIIVCCLSFVMIWQTKDIQLLADTAIISVLHSPAAAAAMPTDEIYLLAPSILLALFLFFLYRLQELWDAVLELPAIFPDGRILGHNGPRIVTGLLRTHFRWMDQDAHSTRLIEKSFSVLLAYWAVPLVLLMYWARYLTAQEFHGTLLHQVLLLIAAGVAFYCSTRIGRPKQKWATDEKPTAPVLEKLRTLRPVTLLATIFVVMSLLAAGIIAGVPHDKQRAPQFFSADPRRWASTAMWLVGYDPYAELTEASISRRPSSWNGADDQISAVSGARLSSTKFRYAQAYEIFLVNAHLFKADLQGAFLSGGDLRNADLGQANLKFATLDRANLQHANLDRAQIDGANLSRTDLRSANLSYSSLVGASLPDARLEGASLYSSNLNDASVLRANLEKADLREAKLNNANLEGADLQQSYLWSAKLAGANLRKAQLGTAIFIDADLQAADLSGAQLNGTVLNGTNLQGAILDGADFHGALQLTAAQVCSAKSRNGASFDDALRTQIDSQCGTPQQQAAAAPQPAATK